MHFRKIMKEDIIKHNSLKSKEKLLKSIHSRINYFYAKTDGSFEYPNSAEGDLILMIHRYILMNDLEHAKEFADNA